MTESTLFEVRKTESQSRLDGLRTELTTKISAGGGPNNNPDICIFASGSLARLEASAHSDLDAFFFLTGNKRDTPLSRIADVKILNAIIDSAQASGFPDFSNDGEYLQFMHIQDVIDGIGGREDDYQNAFTARMLLILESKYIYNEKLFRQFRFDVIERYFKDFHKHANDFKPIFILNDVLRFWRTLCLNYENGRHWRNASDTRERAKGHLSNLKLRFSRLSICFSFVALLLKNNGSVFPEKMIEICDMTPIERLNSLASIRNIQIDIEGALFEYEWFLDALAYPKDEVLDWIGDKTKRTEAFAHSDKFVSAMFSVVRKIAEDNGYLRYLVI